jgi:uncharacterized protein (TIRG00374 family)
LSGQRRYPWKQRALLVAIGLTAFLVYLFFLVPLNELATTLQRANLSYFLLAFCALFASLAVSSLAWQYLLGLLSVKAPFLKAFQFVLVEGFVDLVLPGEPISGDASRVYLMCNECGGNYGKVVASVVGHRILTTSVAVGGLIISIVYFALTYKPPSLILGFAVAVAFGDALLIALLFYFGTRKEATKRAANWLINLLVRLSRGRWQFEHLRGRIARTLDVFQEEVVTLERNPKGLILCFLFSVLGWFLDISIAVLVFLSLGSLGTTISFSGVVIGYSIGASIQYVPVGIIPGEAGITEGLMTSLFLLLGNHQARAVFAAAAVLIRILTFGVRLLVGALVVQLLGIKDLMPSIRSEPQ